MTIKVKICGITNVQDARCAVSFGASYAGMIFADASPRKVDIQTAQEIRKAVGNTCEVVGVFQDTPLPDVLKLVQDVELDLVQLHGIETPEYCSAFKLPLIKVFNLDFVSGTDPRQYLSLYQGYCDFVMFDKPKGLVAPDWLDRAVSALEKIEQDLPPYFLAGGLLPENLEKVLTVISPYCVDVASGVESTVRQKDPRLVKDFCDAALKTGRSVIAKDLGG
jgi:phosphoribosylanthranilate isomerase